MTSFWVFLEFFDFLEPDFLELFKAFQTVWWGWHTAVSLNKSYVQICTKVYSYLYCVLTAEDNNKEIIELQDLRMSPIPSIRNRFGGAQGGRTRSDVADNFPPSFRINRGYSTASGGRSSATGLRRSASGTSGSAMEKARQSRLLSQLKKGTSTLKAALPRIKDVNIIDKYSRVIFPVSFLVFNIAYWCFYVLEKNEEWTIMITWHTSITYYTTNDISISISSRFHFLLAKSDT